MQSPSVGEIETEPVGQTRGSGVGDAPLSLASLVGRAIRIAGEICCRQDLYVDGEVEGQIELSDHKLTIGPLARVKATIRAHEVVIVGRAEGKIQATERVELGSQCSLIADIETPRIVIQDGAQFKGTIHTAQPAAEPLASRNAVTPD